MKERINNVFDREYDIFKHKNVRSIEKVCECIFSSKDYKFWKGISKFDHIMEHLKTSGDLKNLTFGTFIDALVKSGFNDTVQEFEEVIDDQNTQDAEKIYDEDSNGSSLSSLSSVITTKS